MGVCRTSHLKRAVRGGEPGIAAAELAGRLSFELFMEFAEPAEGIVDPFGKGGAGLSAAVWAHAVPQEGVIPGLGCVVEDLGLGFLVALGGGQYDLLEPHLFEGCARDQLVELVD